MDVLISSINYDINSQTCVPSTLIANVKDVGTRVVQVNVYNGALALSLPQGCVVTASMVVDDTLIYGGDESVPCAYENNTISVPLGTTEKPLGNLSGNLKVQIKIVDGNQTLQFPIAFKVMLTGDCADESITQAQAGYVDTRLIADGAVTETKLDADLSSKINITVAKSVDDEAEPDATTGGISRHFPGVIGQIVMYEGSIYYLSNILNHGGETTYDWIQLADA